MTPDLTGQTISSVAYAYAIDINTVEGWQITIETDFTLDTGGVKLSRGNGEIDDMVERIRSHIGERLTSFAIEPAGTLTFGIGADMVCAPASDDYEAWNVSGPAKQLVVCTPGGELAIWS